MEIGLVSASYKISDYRSLLKSSKRMQIAFRTHFRDVNEILKEKREKRKRRDIEEEKRRRREREGEEKEKR